MLDVSTIVLFSAAALVLLIIPGPAVLYVVARSIDQGRVAGFVSVLAVSTGAYCQIVAAAFGISALLVSSAIAFSFVKYLGAAYLIYLGAHKLLKKDDSTEIDKPEAQMLWPIYRQGVLVSLLNPKSALFFFAFLPQFVDPARGPVQVQILLLGLIFVALAICSDSIYALGADTLGSWLKRNSGFLHRQRYFTGGVYIALGLATAVSGTDSK
ncbi:LysE family translocator [Chloroflexi bacterium TSY]|nr:LysE family translocator [Chloroflexi bacterium TSY]